MTPSQLSAIRARLDAATWKEWNPQIDYVEASHGFVSGVRVITDAIRYCWPDQDDAVDAQAHAFCDLIASAADDLRALLDEVERLKNDLAMARQVSGELCEACGWAMKFPGEPCRCELLRWRDEWESFKARMTEQDASSFRRGAEAMRTSAIAVASKRANLPKHSDLDSAWCRSAECILDELRNLPLPEDK
jgi:hypothetical protein